MATNISIMDQYRDKITDRIHLFAAYLMTLYFFEIISLMFALLIIYGKAISIVSGFICALLLTIHIIKVYYKSNLNRMIQLFFMDLHAAFTIAYIFNHILKGMEMTFNNTAILVLRTVLLIIDCFLIYFLTEDRVSAIFKKK